MKNNTILVLGATGFIGSRFIKHAIKKGFNIIAISKKKKI